MPPKAQEVKKVAVKKPAPKPKAGIVKKPAQAEKAKWTELETPEPASGTELAKLEDARANFQGFKV